MFGLSQSNSVFNSILLQFKIAPSCVDNFLARPTSITSDSGPPMYTNQIVL